MFQLSPFPAGPYVFRPGYHGMTRGAFPHSEIYGSKLASQLPVAYRRLATSFFGSMRQGIHHIPFSS